MNLKPVTLQLLAGVAALSAVTAADKPKGDPPAIPAEQRPAAPPVDLKALFAMADANKDGVVTFDEFKKAYIELEKRMLAAKNPPVHPRRPIDPCLGCGLG